MTWPMFWHQFKAGPWWRFIPIGLFAAFLSLAPLFPSSPLSVIAPAIAAPVWFLVFIPERDFAQSYGLTRAQALRIYAIGAVPAALLASVPALTRLNTAGIVGAILAWVVTAAMVAISLPNGEPKRPGATKRSLFRGSSLEFALFWRRPLLWGLAAGLAVGAATLIGRNIDNETLRQVLIAFPILVLWFALLAAPELQPATARSLGLARRAWAKRCVTVAIGVNLVFALAAGGTLILIDAPLAPLATITGISAVVVFASHALLPSTEFFSFALPTLFFFPTRLFPDPLSAAGRGEYIAAAVLSAIALVAGVAVLALYVTGRVNVSRGSERFFGTNQTK